MDGGLESNTPASMDHVKSDLRAAAGHFGEVKDSLKSAADSMLGVIKGRSATVGDKMLKKPAHDLGKFFKEALDSGRSAFEAKKSQLSLSVRKGVVNARVKVGDALADVRDGLYKTAENSRKSKSEAAAEPSSVPKFVVPKKPLPVPPKKDVKPSAKQPVMSEAERKEQLAENMKDIPPPAASRRRNPPNKPLPPIPGELPALPPRQSQKPEGK